MISTRTQSSPIAVGMKQISHWIGGKLVAGTSRRRGPIYNPATGAQTGLVDLASAAELDAAAETAVEAFPKWRATPRARRTEILFHFRDLLERHRTDIARLITAEHGKVLSDALGEVARGLENVEFACGVPHLLKGGFSEQASRGVDVYSIRQPLGVVAGITPFNFPAMGRCRCSPAPSPAATASSSSPARRIRHPRSSSPSSGRRRGCRPASSRWCRATARR